MPIREIESDEDVRQSFPVMHQLRPHLEQAEYVTRVRAQRAGGYRLAVVEEDGVVRAAAGFRILEMLVQGRHMYIDDLVTDDAERSKGHGDALFDWLKQLAMDDACVMLELDSGVHRFRAHGFYFRKRMHIASYHFKLALR
jgi:GNAT superfamily N-acetyltransferase